MKRNVGTADRIIRVIIGVAILTWGIIAKNWWGAIGIVPLLTGLIGWCALYQVIGGMGCPLCKKDGNKREEPDKK